MTTDVTIGRFGVSTDIGVSAWDVAGDEVRAAGFINNTDRALIALARQQLNGLSESDERVVPVTFASDSSQDGYYRVEGTSIPMDVGRYAAKSLPWSASLTRVPNFSRPMIEVRSQGKVRTNVDSFTTNITPTVVIPEPLAVDAPDTAPTYSTAFGNIAILDHSTLTNAVTSYQVAASGYYSGACRVEQLIGATWYPIVGRSTNAAATAMRVNNGLIRLTGNDAGTPTDSGLLLAGWDGTTWGADKAWKFKRAGSTLVQDGPAGVEIVRNLPEEVKVKFTFPANNGTVTTILEVYVRLRRGWRMADVSINLPDGVNATWSVGNSEALSAQTGGYDATSADANSMKVVFARRSSTSLADSNTSVVYGSSDGIVFGLGVRLTDSDPWGSTANTMARWFADLGTTQTISGP